MDVSPNSRAAAQEKRSGGAPDHVPGEEEKLDETLRDSMDASDPPAHSHPADDGGPVPSSGFEEKPGR